MKTRSFVTICFLAYLTITIASTNAALAQTKSSTIDGSWLGKLKTQGVELRLVFNISKASDNTLKSTLDSPDQGAKGIPLGKTTWDGKSLNIEAANMAASFAGSMINDSTIDGTWTQAGVGYPIKMVKQSKVLVLNRPQEPKPPFSYLAEEVTITNKKFGFNLGGTLTLPKGSGPFPSVVLITGSGQQNRDEEIFDHKPFLVIANYLTNRGFAVLRCDDRGVGKSKGSLVNVTSYDFSTDIQAAVDFLKGDKRIDGNKIGLLGHSEGGLIAQIVATERNDIAFIVSLAGPGIKGENILLDQNVVIPRLMGAPESEIESMAEMNKGMYKILEDENDNNKAQQQITIFLRDYLTKQKETDIEEKITSIINGFPLRAYSWLRYFLLSDPSKYLEKIKCPVLALNGSKDVQVIAKSNLPAIEKSLKSNGNKDVTVIELKDLNHLFQHCKTGLTNEYGAVEETFSEEALQTIGDWLSKRFLL